MVRVKGHKTKTTTFPKRTDALLWARETETRIRQSQYFPDRLVASEKKTLGDLLDMPQPRFGSAVNSPHPIKHLNIYSYWYGWAGRYAGGAAGLKRDDFMCFGG